MENVLAVDNRPKVSMDSFLPGFAQAFWARWARSRLLPIYGSFRGLPTWQPCSDWSLGPQPTWHPHPVVENSRLITTRHIMFPSVSTGGPRRSFKLGIFFQNEQHHHPFFVEKK
ncbi:hypothetical protein GBA52_028308 [Prunus armeniaca]|nr:hypothetical protein GBA52_028308 [Prunus armeniaca]